MSYVVVGHEWARLSFWGSPGTRSYSFKKKTNNILPIHSPMPSICSTRGLVNAVTPWYAIHTKLLFILAIMPDTSEKNPIALIQKKDLHLLHYKRPLLSNLKVQQDIWRPPLIRVRALHSWPELDVD